MKKRYIPAKAEPLELMTEDIITASGDQGIGNETEDEDNPFARSYDNSYVNSYNYIER